MDTAKAVGIIVDEPEFADVRSLEGVAPTKKPCVPILAVPTTAGTAAEVTINYVITDVEKKRKFVCVDHARHPRRRGRRSGDDEPRCRRGSPLDRHGRPHPRDRGLHHEGRLGDDDMLHLEAIRLISTNLRDAVANKPSGREAGMALGQYIAGMGFSNVGLGVDHSMAHGLSAKYDTPHGKACAILLPTVMTRRGGS
jgi:lactaldehyde reductase